MNFQTWIELKKLKTHDLIFTKTLKTEAHQQIFSQVCEQMAGFTPSFSEGLAFLEMVTDLVLMGHTEDLFTGSENFENWQNNVKRLRYPQTSARDENLKQKFETLPWPQGAKIKFERRGDKAGVEMKVFISSPADLTKIMASLERVQKDLNS